MNIIKGDILQATEDVIIHQVNCRGVMGGGLALQIRKKYPEVYEKYNYLCRQTAPSVLLGLCISVAAQDGKIIANCFGQKDFGINEQHTDYSALRKSLELAIQHNPNKSFAIPYKLGCGLAGGDWGIVSKNIETVFSGVDYTIYQLGE